MTPAEIVYEEHRNYYVNGGYGEDRYRWTVGTFFREERGKRVLEVGCGDGRLLSLLQATNEVYGIDASQTGIEGCLARRIPAVCLDASSHPLPFPDDHFDSVIILETLEHMMNPYYALVEIRRVLKEDGKLVCSVPNPATGHPYLYPGLFEFPNFNIFLRQLGWRIDRVQPWQWAPREAMLPAVLRRFRILRSRYVAGVIRRAVEWAYRAVSRFPWFCYWLWTFECTNVNKGSVDRLREQAAKTKPQDHQAT
jgi:SAM-dependent methyltransferase